MRRILLTTTVAAGMFFPVISGQERLDLTGTWVMDVTRSESGKGAAHTPEPSELAPVTLVITQSADHVVIERRRGGKIDVITYPFENSEPQHRPQLDPRAEPVGTSGSSGVGGEIAAVLGSEVQETRADHKDGRIVTKTVMAINGKTVTTDESLRLSRNGAELIVERLLQVHHGYDLAKADAVARDVYVKSSR
jgi:hypothetical protein